MLVYQVFLELREKFTVKVSSISVVSESATSRCTAFFFFIIALLVIPCGFKARIISSKFSQFLEEVKFIIFGKIEKIGSIFQEGRKLPICVFCRSDACFQCHFRIIQYFLPILFAKLSCAIGLDVGKFLGCLGLF